MFSSDRNKGTCYKSSAGSLVQRCLTSMLHACLVAKECNPWLSHQFQTHTSASYCTYTKERRGSPRLRLQPLTLLTSIFRRWSSVYSPLPQIALCRNRILRYASTRGAACYFTFLLMHKFLYWDKISAFVRSVIRTVRADQHWVWETRNMRQALDPCTR